ncbi:MAG TPA: cytochrome c biogenesis protein ResB [Dehalococcoidia bacterium]
MATQTVVRPRIASGADPFRWLFRLFTSVRFALILIAFLAVSALAGVILPQLPSEMRGNPAAMSAWISFEEDRFGVFGPPLYRLGLFTIFGSTWFVTGLAMLVISVCVCTMNRFTPVWRNVTRPQTRVPDDYFERGQPVIAVEAQNVDALAAELKRRRFRVEVASEGTTRYLFADRFPWSQLATFVSHLALILFIAGGFVTLLTAKEEQVFAGEGTSAPVFDTADRDHMQIYVVDAVGKFDATGFPEDYRTQLIVYKGGKEVARGVSTVNKPLSYGGFKFHQSAFFPDGAALTVKDLTTGRTVYDDVLALTSSAATPRIVVTDAAGTQLLDDAIVPTDFLAGVAGTRVVIPGRDTELWVGAQPQPSGSWQLVVFETKGTSGAQAVLQEGQKTALGDMALTFIGMTGVPSTVVDNLPGADAGSVAELSDGPSGKVLTVGPVQGQALALAPGEAVQAGGYEYTFGGTREFAGITVRRDPGGLFIWVATGLLLLGLALTFYIPRRRLWGKISAGQATFRGLGGRFSSIERELRSAVAAANSAS